MFLLLGLGSVVILWWGGVAQSWTDVTCEVLRSLVLLVYLRYCPRFSLGAFQCLVGTLVLSVLLLCGGMVPQCVHVESPSWFHSLNRQDHDKYTQMTAWLVCHEKIQIHTAFIRWQQQSDLAPTQHLVPIGPLQVQLWFPKMT